MFYVVKLYDKRNEEVYSTKMSSHEASKLMGSSWVDKGILGARSYKIIKDNGITISGE